MNDIDNFTKEGFQILKEATINSNALPSDRDYSFYSTNDSFNRVMKNESDKILKMMNTIMKHYGINENFKSRTNDEKGELLIEGNDVILEQVSINIDEMNGIKRIPDESVVIQTVTAQLPVGGSWNKVNKATFSVSSSISSQVGKKPQESTIRLLTAQNILRPQKFFKDKIDNSNHPWEPRIKEKPNSLAPLAIFLEHSENGEEFSHPYEFELEKFKPPPDLLTTCDPVLPKKVEDTPLNEVSTPEALDKLVEDLRKYDVIAVDLEHHSYRTFMGITCLMQISTVDTDYIIDTLALRDKLYILNEIFTKPTILKVFHGAEHDIQWLQRDLSLYVVNMFDTHKAAKILGYSGLSLAYLVNRFCKFLPNKQFQLADWRIRPLPEQLISYAREDTHYLIYIYQKLRNELLAKGNGDNLLRAVFNESREVCLKRYLKPRWTEESHLEFYRKGKRLFDNRQMYALKEIYKWRDSIAREEDESTGYVLPNHMLFQISETLPKEMQGILACCSPVPPLVRANLLELHHIILRAREQSVQKEIMKEDNRSRGNTQKLSKVNIDSPLYCPHDLTRIQEFRDDLPTLLNSKNQQKISILSTTLSIEKIRPRLSIFDTPDTSEDEIVSNHKLKSLKFLGPYERYKLVKPFLQAEEKAAKLKEESQQINKGTTDDAPVEDRIASLHEHFKQVVQEVKDTSTTEDQIPFEAPAQPNIETSSTSQTPVRSLVEMGGKKRKRNWKKDLDDVPSKLPKFFHNTPNRRREFNEQRGNVNQHKKQKVDNVQAQGSSNQNTQLTPQHPKNNRNRKKSFNKNSNKQQNTAFDYSNVDYNQFQGGAQAAHTGNRFNTSWRGKKKNKNRGGGKQNNKSVSFMHKKH